MNKKIAILAALLNLAALGTAQANCACVKWETRCAPTRYCDGNGSQCRTIDVCKQVCVDQRCLTSLPPDTRSTQTATQYADNGGAACMPALAFCNPRIGITCCSPNSCTAAGICRP